MKHTLLFLFAYFLIMTGFARAQDQTAESTASAPTAASSPERFVRRAIIDASLLNAGFEGSGTERYSKPNGYAVGLLFDLIGTQNWVLETGVSYRQLGTNVNNGLGDNTFTANYISVPVSAKYYLSGQEGSSLYLKAGVVGSVLISNNDIYATPTTKVGPNSWENAFMAGLGYKMKLASAVDLMLEANYTRSVDSIYSNDTVYRSDLGATLGVSVDL